MGISRVIFDFICYLSLGTFMSMGLLRQKSVGRNYFIYHGVGSTLLTLGVYLWLGRTQLDLDSQYWLIGFMVFAGLFSFTVSVKHKLAIFAFFTASICALATILMAVTSAYPFPLHNSMSLNAVLSCLILGFSMNAMLVGHWYLVQPKLSIDELKRVTLVLCILILARFVFGTGSFVMLLNGKSEGQIYRYLLVENPGIFVLMRWSWGLLGPICLVYPIWKTVSMRSTQSATGLLYVLVLFTITGEILSLYLAAVHRIAL